MLLLNISRASVQTSGMEQNRQEGGGGLETRRRSLRPKLDPTAVAARLGREGDLGECKKKGQRCGFEGAVHPITSSARRRREGQGLGAV